MLDDKGNVSVFVIITFTAMICIMFILIDFTRIQSTRNELRRDAFLAVESTFAGYNRELKEQYGLFAIRDQENYEIEEKITKYIQQNQSKNKLKKYKLIYANILESKSLSNINELENQIINYMKPRFVNVIAENKKRIEEVFLVLNDKVKIQNDIESKKTNPISEEEYSQIEHYKAYDNRKDIESAINSRYLQKDDVIIPDSYLKIVNETFDEEIFEIDDSKEYLKEELKKISDNSIIEKEYIVEYVIQKFNSRINKKFQKDQLFNSEIEFIIGGNRSENKNNENIEKKILKTIFPFELKKVYEDEEKLILAELTAQAVSGWWSTPIGVTICKNLILASMAFENGVKQVDDIVNGEKYYALSNVQLEYEDFLKIFLYFMDKEMILKRLVQIIDVNLKVINISFDISSAKVWMKLKVCIENDFLFMTKSCFPNLWGMEKGMKVYDEIVYGY